MATTDHPPLIVTVATPPIPTAVDPILVAMIAMTMTMTMTMKMTNSSQLALMTSHDIACHVHDAMQYCIPKSPASPPLTPPPRPPPRPRPPRPPRLAVPFVVVVVVVLVVAFGTNINVVHYDRPRRRRRQLEEKGQDGRCRRRRWTPMMMISLL